MFNYMFVFYTLAVCHSARSNISTYQVRTGKKNLAEMTIKLLYNAKNPTPQ